MLGIYFNPIQGMEVEGEHRWNKPEIPHRGWNHLGVEVLDEATGICGMCDKTRICYMHTVQHPNYDNLQVGYVCEKKCAKIT